MISEIYQPSYGRNGTAMPITKALPPAIPINQQEKKKDSLVESFKKLAPIRQANKRLADASNQPAIRKLCGVFWMLFELHILFADTGVGKSIMAVAIADALSRGECFLKLDNENEPLKVLIYDFELSDKQAEKRYSDDLDGTPYEFSEYLYYDTIDFIALDELANNTNSKVDELLFEKMKYDIEDLGINVLMIDNITFLCQYTTQNTDSALHLMRQLNKLKRELSISILVLAHTPKINQSEPITINHLAGSKHLSNFADSVSAIGKSTWSPNVRYWKQVKPSRSAELIYDIDNVITCELDKKDSRFLTYHFIANDGEREHLKKDEENDRLSQIALAKELRNQGKKLTEIAEEILGDAKLKGTISKWLNKAS